VLADAPAHFIPYGPAHLGALGFFAMLAVTLYILRVKHPRTAQAAERTLGTLLLLVWPLSLLLYSVQGTLNAQNALPLHYCDVAGICAGLALWIDRPSLREVAYFFGLAGTTQGLITPALDAPFPEPRFLLFFLLHGGVVVTALHLVLAIGFRPRPNAPFRVLLISAAYAVSVGLVNALLHTNYGFICSKPPVASLMDFLGPWPWYVLALFTLAGIIYWLLALPWKIKALQPPSNHVS
jgi:hypothetical integral membrane protein (TIGR02206 family)